MRRVISIFASVLFLLSCDTRDASSDATGQIEPYTIGVAICMTEDTPFFVSLIQGAREAAQELGVDLLVVYADENCNLQAKQIIRLSRQNIDALLLNPVSYGTDPACDNLIHAMKIVQTGSIPILTIDRGFRDNGIICHIASDNRSGGRMAGDYLAESMNRSGNIVEITGTPGSSAAMERGRGFREAIAQYPDIDLIASVNADFDKDEAEEAFAQILSEYDSIGGVFAHNDDMVLGAIDAAFEQGRDGILFVGFDAIDDAVAAVEKGDLLATVAQRPEEMGRLGVETAVDYLNGKDVPDSIIVDLALILR